VSVQPARKDRKEDWSDTGNSSSESREGKEDGRTDRLTVIRIVYSLSQLLPLSLSFCARVCCACVCACRACVRGEACLSRKGFFNLNTSCEKLQEVNARTEAHFPFSHPLSLSPFLSLSFSGSFFLSIVCFVSILLLLLLFALKEGSKEKMGTTLFHSYFH